MSKRKQAAKATEEKTKKRQKRSPLRDIKELEEHKLVRLFKPKALERVGDMDEQTIIENLKTLPFTQGHVIIFGRKTPEPRLTALFAKHLPTGSSMTYSYSGKTMTAYAPTEFVSSIFSAVEKETGTTYDVVLFNWYKDGQQSIGWHSDDEKELSGKCIASLSYGTERDFVLREKQDHSKRWSIPLGHGDLFCILKDYQTKLKHNIPKHIHIKNKKFNLTFRSLEKKQSNLFT
jgi:alkylated DNA repair dioxygenase AlkB